MSHKIAWISHNILSPDAKINAINNCRAEIALGKTKKGWKRKIRKKREEERERET